MADDTDWISRASGKSPAEATSQGISGVILAAFGAIIVLIGALSDGLASVIGVLGDLRSLIGTFFTSPEIILTMTAEYSGWSLTAGDWAFFGPLTWAVGVGAIAAGFWVWTVLDPDIPFVDELLPWR